jgi:hypothetical protein
MTTIDTPAGFFAASLLLALLASLGFAPGLPGEFLFDDIPNIVNNPGIHLTQLSPETLWALLSQQQLSGATRSLPMLSFALDYWRAGGADPGTFKVTNILIHSLTTGLLAWLLRSLLILAGLSARSAALGALGLALAWALHPLQVSSVLYVVQRLQTLSSLFLVLTLLAYVRGRQAQMAGASGRPALLFGLLCWGLALASKEDAALLPAYGLALELTLLRFAAADAALARRWRRGYLLAALGAAAVYLLWVIPHYWQWGAYAGRDFSSAERLLTQGRVLCLYLWQILVPLPGQMAFYYDWLAPSRGLLQPWTTLPALLLILALLGLAWRLRLRQPLFALGVFWFFAAHFITSNVIGLELAYEHRNHFALIGALLALGDGLGALLSAGARHWPRQRLDRLRLALALIALIALGTATLVRAQSWRTAVSMAEASAAAAPSSPRAWIEVCDGYFQQGGGPAAGRQNPRLADAIRACATGAEAAPQSLNNLVVLLVLKTLDGSIQPADWARLEDRLQARLAAPPMSWDNKRALLIFLHYAKLGVPLDRPRVLGLLKRFSQGVELSPASLAQIGDGILNGLEAPDEAMPYFFQAMEAIPATDAFPWELAAQLRSLNRPDLATAVEQRARARLAQATGE